MADQPFGVAEPVNGANRLWLRRPIGFAHGAFYNMRDQVFHALFYRLAVIYSRSVPRSCRRAFEFLMLFEALIALFIFTYVHFAFNRDPVNCLGEISSNWSRDGVLRVEVLTNSSLLPGYTLDDSFNKEFLMYGSEVESEKIEIPSSESSNSTDGGQVEPDEHNWHDGLSFEWLSWNDEKSSGHGLFNGTFSKFMKVLNHLFTIDNDLEPGIEDVFIYEYTTEFGFLRMSPRTRRKLNITTTFVVLDPRKESCFGNIFGKALLSEFLGYDDILLYSLKHVAGDSQHKGYCRNIATGDYYKFVDMSVSRLSYIPAALLLVLFTTSISMLLRYSHQQIFIFMVDVLRVLDRTVITMFPFAPLLTAVLALIGVETLISELFTEASTGFYVILIVWLADQYNVVCCHTVTSRRHWIRFFYLYHFIFYAYHYRFNGHFSFVALTTSWLFIQHSMIYFFHHYELPAIEHQTQVHSLLARVHHQTPVRGLVTVISQTSPTEISRFTLDTRSIQPPQDVPVLEPSTANSSVSDGESVTEPPPDVPITEPAETSSPISDNESSSQTATLSDLKRTSCLNFTSETVLGEMPSQSTNKTSVVDAEKLPVSSAKSSDINDKVVSSIPAACDTEALPDNKVAICKPVNTSVPADQPVTLTPPSLSQSPFSETLSISMDDVISDAPSDVTESVSLTSASLSSSLSSVLNDESAAINLGACDMKSDTCEKNSQDVDNTLPVYNSFSL